MGIADELQARNGSREVIRSPGRFSRKATPGLPNFYNIAIRIANVAARLAVLGRLIRLHQRATALVERTERLVAGQWAFRCIRYSSRLPETVLMVAMIASLAIAVLPASVHEGFSARRYRLRVLLARPSPAAKIPSTRQESEGGVGTASPHKSIPGGRLKYTVVSRRLLYQRDRGPSTSTVTERLSVRR